MTLPVNVCNVRIANDKRDKLFISFQVVFCHLRLQNPVLAKDMPQKVLFLERVNIKIISSNILERK